MIYICSQIFYQFSPFGLFFELQYRYFSMLKDTPPVRKDKDYLCFFSFGLYLMTPIVFSSIPFVIPKVFYCSFPIVNLQLFKGVPTVYLQLYLSITFRILLITFSSHVYIPLVFLLFSLVSYKCANQRYQKLLSTFCFSLCTIIVYSFSVYNGL